MAYNNGFPMSYPQYYQPQQYQPTVQSVAPVNHGFIRVQNEDEARRYPVAPGNSIMFIDENSPHCYVKTVDMSQLDRPKFDKYKLVKEEDPVPTPSKSEDKVSIEYATKKDLESLMSDVASFKEEIMDIVSAPKGGLTSELDV